MMRSHPNRGCDSRSACIVRSHSTISGWWDADALHSVWGWNVVARPTPECSMSVLVVDADTIQRDSLRAILGEQYELTFVAGLGEALRMVREHRPDLLVSEVDLSDGT